MQRVPVIGQTLSHSPFVAVQKAAIEAAGLDLRLEEWDRKPHQLAEAIEELRTDDVTGALVAQPHKERATGLMDALSDDARHAGAVNVVVHEAEQLRGYNSDIDGLRAGLKRLLPETRGGWPTHAVVLGAGGGARAAVTVLITGGVQRIAVFNRHLHRAEALVGDLARHARGIDLRAMPWHETIIEAELARGGLLVNASGIGHEEGTSPIPAELLPSDLYVLDLVLQHTTTPLMAAARARDGTVANGQASFLASSAATFRVLTGSDPPASVMKAALATELGLPEEHVAVVGD